MKQRNYPPQDELLLSLNGLKATQTLRKRALVEYNTCPLDNRSHGILASTPFDPLIQHLASFLQISLTNFFFGGKILLVMRKNIFLI